MPVKAARMAAVLGLNNGFMLPYAARGLVAALGLPVTYREGGNQVVSIDRLIEGMVASPFNRTSPYVPTREEFGEIVRALI